MSVTDPLQMSPCDPPFIQRFVLVLLNLELNGAHWERSHAWLTGVSECEWANVVCQPREDSSGNVYDAIVQLSLGT